MDLKGKKVTVVGLGNSGVNAALLLNDAGAHVWATDANDNPGIRANVRLFKKRGIKFELGGHTEDFVKGSSLVVLSPGVENSAPPVRWAAKLGMPIISEMELGYRFCKGRIIAVTGTNGKSTVTTLIGEILKGAGLDTVVCGNIGNSLCGEISRIKDDTWVVLEVSSFQLERIEKFRPYIAVILNITDDHLDRYKDFDGYFKEKLKIFCNQVFGDFLILNYDAENIKPLKDMANSKTIFYSKSASAGRFTGLGAYVKDGKIIFELKGKHETVSSVSDIPLKGLHNLENVLASISAGALAGASASSMAKTIKGFKGLAHRVETVACINGVKYVDDSKGTTVDSTLRALESSSGPVILIAGGRDKLSNYNIIREAVKDKVRHLILIGEAKDKIRIALGDIVDTYEAGTMAEAVSLAGRLAGDNSTVLLSPMCSSFDMFRDYKHRGEVFKEEVEKLRRQL